MQFRVREILLVSTMYDAFVLEEDRGVSELILSQYIDLNLRFVPRITRVSTAEEALSELASRNFDLVLTMARLSDMDPVDFGNHVKRLHPDKPVVLLTVEMLSPDLLARFRRAASIDRIFYWLGDSKILLAIIKYVEDAGNVHADTVSGVQTLLIVEDNPKFYSMFLPPLYTEVMTQTQRLISESVNDYQRLLRMRARPKLLLAETYEEAMHLFDKYKRNVLGVISDVAFSRDGRLDQDAGLRLAEAFREKLSDLPILLHSERGEAREEIGIECAFVDKRAPDLLTELRHFLLTDLGFGDFVFRDPAGRELYRACNIQEFEKLIQTCPPESLRYHAARNDISMWLRARTEFAVAEQLRPHRVEDFSDIEALRGHLHDAIRALLNKNRAGSITELSAYAGDVAASFIRIGGGSLGGKARGIAFINGLLDDPSLREKYPTVRIGVPATFVICTDVYEEFLETNQLHRADLVHAEDEAIAERFLASSLSDETLAQLERVVEKIHTPLAVRSSSVLEDSQSLPFAGLYATYMLPNNDPDPLGRLSQLACAVKLVYASVFYRASREYVHNTNYRLEDEKMGVIIQEVAGRRRGNLFYPMVSGVAQSHNFYPTSPIRPEDGIASVALGLGKSIVDGENIFRFCPSFPRQNPPYSSPEELMKATQHHFYALDLSRPRSAVERDERFSLKRPGLKRARDDGTLASVAGSYSAQDERIRRGITDTGPWVVDFAGLRAGRPVPLPEIVVDLLELGRSSFGAEVEIEFALNLKEDEADSAPAEFHFLQIRPLVVGRETVEVAHGDADLDEAVCASTHAMGNGLFQDLYDVVYVDPKRFDVTATERMAQEIGELNAQIKRENRRYILIGFGRWGTADRWLGIPVDWSHISNALVIVESDLDDFRVDPSQGSHFFHNVISLKLGYFHVRQPRAEEFIRWDWLDSQEVVREGRYVRHVRTASPLVAKVDGRCARGVILTH
ncbi:MAG: phosphoenolpyruvate synthase [Spirochaetales bacterium]|nr:phosphoenolpyruvate synthase [Spirochaetales bacterium]